MSSNWSYMSKNDQLMLWKIAIRELYYLELIEESMFMRLYNYDDVDTLSTSAEDQYCIDIVYETMKNVELMAQDLHEEVDIIAHGIIPNDKRVFKKMWLSYLLDCSERGLITQIDFNELRYQIDFMNSEWSDIELVSANSVVDMIRFMLIEKNPSSIEYLDNPSFELLMYANNLEYV